MSRVNVRMNADDWTVSVSTRRKSRAKAKRESLLTHFCKERCPHADNPNACDCEEFKAYRKAITKRRRDKV